MEHYFYGIIMRLQDYLKLEW